MSTPFQLKQYKIIQDLAARQFRKNNNQLVGTLVSEPALKPVKGPNATAPYEPGDDRDSDPDTVLAWFADVRLSNAAGSAFLRDCIVPTQARGNIGKEGSPVVVYRDPTSGRFEVVGRADRVTSTQSVKSYTTSELRVGFARGHRVDGVDGVDVVSPFYQYTSEAGSILTATNDDGHQEAGLNRGVQGWTTGGAPLTSYELGVTVVPVPIGELVWGVDAFGIVYETTNNPDGTTTTIKR